MTMSANRTYDMPGDSVIIVGAGHNGLVAANYLAKAGRKVLVLERRDRAGGQLASDAFDGVAFDPLHAGGQLRPDIVRDLDQEVIGTHAEGPTGRRARCRGYCWPASTCRMRNRYRVRWCKRARPGLAADSATSELACTRTSARSAPKCASTGRLRPRALREWLGCHPIPPEQQR